MDGRGLFTAWFARKNYGDITNLQIKKAKMAAI